MFCPNHVQQAFKFSTFMPWKSENNLSITYYRVTLSHAPSNYLIKNRKQLQISFKGQMNQNLNIFSLAILKRRNVKQNIQKETYAEIFLTYEDSRCLQENVSKMAAQFNGKNGAETLLCDVTVVLNISAF